MLQSSLTYVNEQDAWKQRVRRELGNTQKFYQSMASNWQEGSPGMSMRSAGASNMRPYIKTNSDNNQARKQHQHMMPINCSSYLIASNPNSMRDMGMCRNAVYQVGEPGAGDVELDSTYLAGQEFLASSANFNPTGERWGYVKAHQGDRRVQGVIEYPNQDIYAFGGKTKITSAMDEASIDLDQTATHGLQYFDSVRPETAAPKQVDKEYHEHVNDYTKNISQGIFSPGLVLSQYAENIREKEPGYQTMTTMKRSSSAGRSRKGRPRNGAEEIRRRVEAQRGYALKLARRRTVESG
jgi:hypothetical protein